MVLSAHGIIKLAVKQTKKAPLDAEKIFLGGDDWLTLKAQLVAPPQQSKRIKQAHNNDRKLAIQSICGRCCTLIISEAKHRLPLWLD